MIDIEYELFTKATEILRSRFGSDFTVYGATVLAPSAFPCICIEESDNFPLVRTQDSGSNENHVELVYDVNVYSNAEEPYAITQAEIEKRRARREKSEFEKMAAKMNAFAIQFNARKANGKEVGNG